MAGDTLTMLVEPEPTVLVALTNCADPSMLVSATVTEGLLTYDFDLTPQPELATAPDTECVVVADLDLAAMRDVRRRLPAMTHRRAAELYERDAAAAADA